MGSCVIVNCSKFCKTKETRLHKHVIDINKKSGFLSVISNHRLENNREMNWND